MKLRLIGASTAVLAVVATAACGGGARTAPPRDRPRRSPTGPATRAPAWRTTRQILAPELNKFEKQTGIKVKLEVIGWPDLLNRILAATTSGQGPDVLNIGNTWSASLQATGAFCRSTRQALDAIGGKDRFVDAALADRRRGGQGPASVPLYSLAYGLYYNKKMFADAGITAPDDLGRAGRRRPRS